ncbi:MAG: helix-turn-helix transcriptional regulator [Propionibacteriaceae bacterium]|jgi:AraC-like DNA-binding protein|nr:helix-turn-helix transcriptional regulator [Propionibacteriaceae bacterium]
MSGRCGVVELHKGERLAPDISVEIDTELELWSAALAPPLVQPVSESISSAVGRPSETAARLFVSECRAESLAQALNCLERCLDVVWAEPIAIRADRVGQLEEAILETARLLCPAEVGHLRFVIRRQRADDPLRYNRFVVQTNLEALLIGLVEAVRRQRPDRGRNFQDLLNALEKPRPRAFSLTEAATFLYLSPGHLSKKFKAVTGQSFISYVTQRRMRRARLMLMYTDLPVLTIASHLGFNQANYFARVFRAATGISPGEYRRQHQVCSARPELR